jgi:hypothetical protein
VQSLAGGLGATVLQRTVVFLIAAAGFGVLTGLLVREARRSGDTALRRTILGATYYVLVSILMCAVLRPQYVVHFVRNGYYWGADRYFVVPSFYFLLLVILAWSRLELLRVPRPARLAAAVLYGAIVLMNFRYPAIPDYQWRRQLGAYYERLLEYPPNQPASTFPIVTFPGDPWTLQAPLYPPPDSQREQLRRLAAKLAR